MTEDAYASDENGAIECGIEAVRLGIWHDDRARRCRPARDPAAGTAQATPDFSFADRYRSFCLVRQSDSTPRVAAVGPQSCSRAGLSVFGRIDNFTIHFQPSGFNRFFGVPMTELTDAGHDAHAVIGPEVSTLEHELGDVSGFAERIQLIEKRLIPLAHCQSRPDAVAIAANRLFASHGILRVSAMANAAGLSTRQFERRFLAQVGVPPKLYARIIRFNAVLDHKLRFPSRPWSRIANDHDYYDQMHFVHDCRAFTGEPLHDSCAARRPARVSYVLRDGKPPAQ